MPIVSVILTSFNHEKFIGDAIDSVLSQTIADLELIIWDDASTDDSWKIINSYSDPRVIKFRNETNKRGVYGINKAISGVAKGEFIAIHHSDDIWKPNKIEKQLNFLISNPSFGAVFSNAQAVSESGAPLKDESNFYSYIFSQENRSRYEWLNSFICDGNSLCHPSVLLRKSCYEMCGLYRYGLAQLGDLDMWVRLCMKYDIHVLPEKLVSFRARDNKSNGSADTIVKRSRLYTEYYLIIKFFLKGTDLSDFLLIFPESNKYYVNDETIIEYLCAMMLLESVSFPLSKIIALEILFDVINDPAKSNAVFNHYGFTPSDFAELTRKHGIANVSVIDYEKSIICHAEVVSKHNALKRKVDLMEDNVISKTLYRLVLLANSIKFKN